MSLPLEEQLPAESDSGTAGSTGFMALVGAIGGGLPQFLIPTSTLVEIIGNTVMGGILVAVVDTILVRKTLGPEQIRKGRMLLIFFVSVTLTLVTYRTARGVFQNTFGTAPPLEVQSLSASAYTRGRIGRVAYRLSFVVDGIGLKKITDEMETLKTAQYSEYEAGANWAAFVKSADPDDAGLPEAVFHFAEPQGMVWRTLAPGVRDPAASPGREARTVLLRDKKTGAAYVHHIAG